MIRRPRIAVVGAGIAGLGAAWHLQDDAEVTLFEADDRLGGHAHTVDITLDGITHGVDTGFLVYNLRTYPRLRALFAELGVATAAAEMSFSVQAPAAGGGTLEWAGTSLDAVFADRRNLLRPSFLAMLGDILRFNRLATGLAESGADAALAQPVGDFLAAHRFSTAFREGYLLPMIGCIWSCPTEQMLRFPIATLRRFCHNHGLLQVADRPQWYTVRGGSKHYVDAIAARILRRRTGCPVQAVERGHGADAGVRLRTAQGVEGFDAVVLACHADQALALLADARPAERRVLGAIRYQMNDAVLHTDERLLPTRRKAWAAWNYERAAEAGSEQARVCLHYLINRLQPLPWSRPVVVSLNPVRAPREETVLRRIAYAHPVFDAAAIAAQRELPALQGEGNVWFCGAWTGYGFHEDGLTSGADVAAQLRERLAHPVAPLRDAA